MLSFFQGCFLFVFVFTNVKGILNKVFLLLEQNQEVLVSLSVSMGGFTYLKKNKAQEKICNTLLTSEWVPHTDGEDGEKRKKKFSH